VIHAFIIALYAGTYGLTIYQLVRFFGIDQTYLNANLWSTFLGYVEVGIMISMILGYLILFAGIGVFVEGWREPHSSHLTGKPVRHGPAGRRGYGIMSRNPFETIGNAGAITTSRLLPPAICAFPI
jgi:hypothetical protein